MEHEEKGKQYRLEEDHAVLLVRPRGLHLPERHLQVNGGHVAGAFADFGLYVHRNAEALLERGAGPYFYIPKLESHREAALWRDAFLIAEDALGLDRGTIKATVLIETVPAAFEMDAILYELRDHAAGLNAGRWDYIFSVIKRFRSRPGLRAAQPLRRDDDRAVHARVLGAARQDLPRARRARHGRHVGGDPLAHRRGGEPEGVRGGEGRQGARGRGRVRRHLGRPPRLGAGGDGGLRRGAGRPPQPGRAACATTSRSAPTTCSRSPQTPGEVTEEGLRLNINVGIQYISSWLRGNGAAAIYGLMEDAATAEISRAQVWQWIRHGEVLDDGRPVKPDLVRTLATEELEKIRAEIGDDDWFEEQGRPELSRSLFERVALSGDEFVEFLTLPAYEELLKLESG